MAAHGRNEIKSFFTISTDRKQLPHILWSHTMLPACHDSISSNSASWAIERSESFAALSIRPSSCIPCGIHLWRITLVQPVGQAKRELKQVRYWSSTTTVLWHYGIEQWLKQHVSALYICSACWTKMAYHVCGYEARLNCWYVLLSLGGCCRASGWWSSMSRRELRYMQHKLQ